MRMQSDANHKNTAESKCNSAVCDRETASAKHRKNRKNIYKFPLNLFAELIAYKSQVPILVELEKACFPMLMQEESADFEEFIEDEYCSGLILYDDAKPIGYITGVHINEDNSARALRDHPFIQEHQDRIFYISSLAILKEHRSVKALEFLIHETNTLLKSMGYDYFTAYVRKRYGLSRMLSQRVACEVLHTDENWEDTGEPFDYCLVNLKSIPSLPLVADYLFHYIRVIRRKLKRIHSS